MKPTSNKCPTSNLSTARVTSKLAPENKKIKAQWLESRDSSKDQRLPQIASANKLRVKSGRRSRQACSSNISLERMQGVTNSHKRPLISSTAMPASLRQPFHTNKVEMIYFNQKSHGTSLGTRIKSGETEIVSSINFSEDRRPVDSSI